MKKRKVSKSEIFKLTCRNAVFHSKIIEMKKILKTYKHVGEWYDSLKKELDRAEDDCRIGNTYYRKWIK